MPPLCEMQPIKLPKAKEESTSLFSFAVQTHDLTRMERSGEHGYNTMKTSCSQVEGSLHLLPSAGNMVAGSKFMAKS